MSLPDYRHFIVPLLKALAAAPEGLPRRAAFEKVAEMESLSEDQRQQTLPSGELRFRNRIGWAHDALKRFGFSTSPRRGHWQITNAGQDFLDKHPRDAVSKALQKNREVRKAVPRSRGAGKEIDPPEVESDEESGTADERIDSAISDIRQRVANDVLERLRDVDPTVFERLVLKVLHKMGYGARLEAVRHTGKGGDGGIDGVIYLDHLGLQRVHVQAKRWITGTVSRPDVQGFFGSYVGEKASMGVFITTSTFTRGAMDFALRKAGNLVLINGPALANHMIDFSVGVTHETRIVPQLDEDFFEV